MYLHTHGYYMRTKLIFLYMYIHTDMHTYILTLTTQHPKTLCDQWQAVARRP